MTAKQLLSTFVMLGISVFSLSADNGTNPEIENEPVLIPTYPFPVKGPQKGHKSPHRSLFSCTLMGDCLTVVSNFDTMGEVCVSNNTTFATLSESGNLGEGVILILDNYEEGAMTLTVTISGSTYVGNF